MSYVPTTAIDTDAAGIVAINGAQQGSDPAAPGSGHRKIYAKSDGWYDEDNTATVTKIGPTTTHYEPVCDITGSCLVDHFGSPVMAIVSN